MVEIVNTVALIDLRTEVKNVSRSSDCIVGSRYSHPDHEGPYVFPPRARSDKLQCMATNHWWLSTKQRGEVQCPRPTSISDTTLLPLEASPLATSAGANRSSPKLPAGASPYRGALVRPSSSPHSFFVRLASLADATGPRHSRITMFCKRLVANIVQEKATQMAVAPALDHPHGSTVQVRLATFLQAADLARHCVQ